MKKDITNTDYWSWRLSEAKNEGHLQYSVYLANDKIWEDIEIEHTKILLKEVGDKTILDAGCGYGRLAGIFDSSQYVGVDFSESFIEEARARNPGYNFVVANLKNLSPFKFQSFDFAVCSSIKDMVIGNLGIGEWQDILGELKRVAKKIIILEYPNPSQYEIL